jgi:hypothetical protein
VVRCCPDEAGAATIMLSVLAESWHRKVGIPCFMYGSEWTRKMIACLHGKLAGRPSGFPELVIEEENKFLFENRSDRRTPYEVLKHLEKNGIQFLKNFLGRLFEKNPELAKNPELHKTNPRLYYPHVIAETDISIIWSTRMIVSLLRKGVTVIIAPDEYFAVVFYNWCRAAQIKVPEQLSLVCFETLYAADPFRDSIQLQGYPISSVNEGTRGLGYQAFHLFMGDIKIERHSTYTVRGRSCYLDRGSVGFPAKEEIRMDLEGEVE